tara:strand:+ start:815 stop:1711 length:897 start_codon:yes stop_codon:yes gene_type:complete
MSVWQNLFPGNPEGGVEGSLPFRFENFGTFAGPQFSSTNFDYEKLSIEGEWPNSVPGDSYTFTNTDLGAYLYNNRTNYVGFHCDGVSTAQMYLQHSAGDIPIFTVKANITNVLGDTLNTTGNIHAAGNITANGNFIFNGPMQLTGLGDVATKVLAVEAIANSKKSFDIPHPNKEGYRLRHVCVEGPEDGPIYTRGKLEGNLLKLPDYWDGLVDKESISVHLTPIGSFQELFVEKIEWGKNVYIKNASGGPVKCYYQVWAARQYEEKLHVEYEGETPADYPGDNSHFSIAGYDYDRRGN